MEITGGAEAVRAYVDGIEHAVRRRDAQTLVDMMTRVTGETPRMWGAAIGFGQYHYEYASGREGDAGAAGFASGKAATTIYLPDGVGAHREQLDRLGPHSTGVVCLYIKNLDNVDLGVLEAIVDESFRTMSSGNGTWARESRNGRPT